jgi:hypothetical protein
MASTYKLDPHFIAASKQRGPTGACAVSNLDVEYSDYYTTLDAK